VVVRKVSGLWIKNEIDRDKNVPLLDSISSFNLLAETNAISEPEKNPLSKTVKMIMTVSVIQ
jgi:hypothetical protein